MKDKGLSQVSIFFNKFYYQEVVDPRLPNLEKYDIYTIKQIVNNFNISKENYPLPLNYIEGNETITYFNNNALIFSDLSTNTEQKTTEKVKKSYDLLLVYYLYNEEKKRNLNKVKNQEILNLLIRK